MESAVFLDRDNTLIKDESGYVHKPKDLEFLPGVLEGLKKLQEKYKLIIITNQSGIARGYYSIKDYYIFSDFINEKLKREGIEISGEYFCPHHPKANVVEHKKNCNCRKPKTGMLEAAVREHGIDLAKSWLIGDRVSDIQAGEKAGVRSVGILNKGSTIETLEKAGAEVVFNNFLGAVGYILERTNF
ncbi:MAG: HAD family hydrolase [Nanoarchaeota archaeon]|nr:HAD family hydrolase [Nanoarchaeota archaeon]